MTVRSFSDKTRARLLGAIERIAKGISAALGMGVPVIGIKEDPTPALYNDPALARRLGKTFQRVLGGDHVVIRDPEMIGEDFGRYGRTSAKIPIFMFRIGTVGAKDWQKGSAELAGCDGCQPGGNFQHERGGYQADTESQVRPDCQHRFHCWFYR